MQIGRVIAEAKADEMLDQYRLAAYIGWQDHINQMMVLSALGAKRRPKSFKQWLKDMRLAEPEEPLTPEQEREIEQKAIADAEQILKMFQAS